VFEYLGIVHVHRKHGFVTRGDRKAKIISCSQITLMPEDVHNTYWHYDHEWASNRAIDCHTRSLPAGSVRVVFAFQQRDIVEQLDLPVSPPSKPLAGVPKGVYRSMADA
jgi:hypothetical protein